MVYQLRKITGESKVGHTGTLDPDVTGVLPVCIGKATKLVGQLTDTDKTYRCRMRFGICTDTQDISGKILEEMEDDEVRERLCGARMMDSRECTPVAEEPGNEEARHTSGKLQSEINGRRMLETIDEDSARSGIREVIRSFVGEIEQIPPMFSALKVDGMKLVNAARKGVVVERKPRQVTIYSIDEIEISDDLLHVQFTVNCSKGTYVRTLCEDIGSRLGVPACMEELERTRAAGLSLETAFTLAQVEELKQAGRLDECLIPTDEFLKTYPALVVTDDAIKKLIFGNYLYDVDFQDGGCPNLDDLTGRHTSEKGASAVHNSGEKEVPSAQNSQENGALSAQSFPGKNTQTDQYYRIYDRRGLFYAIYRYDGNADCYKCVKMFRDPPQPHGS